jgi:hypothetical protein
MANTRNRDFISEIKTIGLARTNRFTVSLTPPGSNPATIRRVMLFCEVASLPGLNYATTQNRAFGELREVPYDKLFDNITLTFHVDKNMEVKKIFDNWMHMIQNPLTRTFNYYNQYTTDMVIEVQDLMDKTTYQMQMYEVYPKSISAINLDAEAKDTMRLQVTFQYKYWMSNGIEETRTGQKLSTDMVDKYYTDFTGFQERLKKGLGEAGNFVTGAVGQTAMRTFSQVTSRIPSIKF